MVKTWTLPRKRSLLRDRWDEDTERQNLGWWRQFFETVAQSASLSRTSREVTYPVNLEWLPPQNFLAVIEGRYSNPNKSEEQGGPAAHNPDQKERKVALPGLPLWFWELERSDMQTEIYNRVNFLRGEKYTRDNVWDLCIEYMRDCTTEGVDEALLKKLMEGLIFDGDVSNPDNQNQSGPAAPNLETYEERFAALSPDEQEHWLSKAREHEPQFARLQYR